LTSNLAFNTLYQVNGLAYIYALSDPRTKEIRYVGKTFDLKQRLWQHQHDVKKGLNTKKTGWIKSLLKDGYWPTIEELESFPENEFEQWQEAERFWIETLRFYGFRLTNMDSGGGSGRRASIETRLKIGEHSKRRIHTPETRAKISAACKARMTPEERERLRVKCSKNRHTEETKRIISESKLGRPRPPHVRAALLAGSLRWKSEHGFKLKSK
jgi:GIY-YIG catalytic domain/NUMOD3 motif